MALKGWASFAWQADYGQFYLIDEADADFRAPETITPEMEAKRLVALSAGLVVYTNDSLQQHIRITIHDAEPEPFPAEPMSGQPWTQVETVHAWFPSRLFTISSPSMPYPLPSGPIFRLDADHVGVRIAWMEFDRSRDDSLPVEPDVIEVTIWPA